MREKITMIDYKIQFLENLEKKFSEAKEIRAVADRLSDAGFEPYLVGGCLRDLLLAKKPKDWDITTNAKPEEVLKLFPDSIYENQFGTVLVKLKPQIIADSTQKRAEQVQKDTEKEIQRDSALSQSGSATIVEVTTFRKEGKYTDKRHPDEIKFAETIEEDLARRDFTINAMALRLETRNIKHETKNKQENTLHASRFMFHELVDPFNGQEDLHNKIIRAVGNPKERFEEDALRLIRAIRFAAQLEFSIDLETFKAIKEKAGLISFIAKERIKDEFVKIIESENAKLGIELLEQTGLLKHIIPELIEGVGIGQNKHHEYTVFDHLLKSLNYSAQENHPLVVRLAALFHDIGKPRTKQGEGPNSTFYGHETVSSKMAAQIMNRLKFPNEIIEKVIKLIKSHMFVYNSNPELGDVTTDAAVRRIIRRVGPENIWSLYFLRLADRAGSGVKKIEKFDNRHFKFRVEKLLRDPLSVKMLKINGNNVMKELKIDPGPKIGWLLHALLEEVIDNPEKNTEKYLINRIKELNKLSDDELKEFADSSKKEIGLYEEQEEKKIKAKYYVR